MGSDTELKHAGLRQQTAKWNTKCAELEALLVARGNDLQAMQRRLTGPGRRVDRSAAAESWTYQRPCPLWETVVPENPPGKL